MARKIGVSHRVKLTTGGLTRPTLVAILDRNKVKNIRLESEDKELEFIKTLKEDDNVIMILGGSGDRFAAASNRFGEQIGAKVFRVPAHLLSKRRNGSSPDADHELLLTLFQEQPNLFYEFRAPDRNLVLVTELYRVLMDAKRARVACEQQIRTRTVGRIYCSDEGGFPEGKIEDLFDQAKANSKILQTLIQNEETCARELQKVLQQLTVYTSVFRTVTGCGPRIAGAIISAVKDVRRFETEAKFVAFCGVHVLTDGTFARRRIGKTSNWHPEARQALYLLGDQFNRRPDSDWGKKLLENKKNFRIKHPTVLIVNGKKRYTDGHIHKMATWRTITQFTEWLYGEWSRLEKLPA